MDDLAKRYLGHQTINLFEEIAGKGKKSADLPTKFHWEKAAEYAAEDADDNETATERYGKTL